MYALIVWIVAVAFELLFSFGLFYAVFYGTRPVNRSKVTGLTLGVVVWAGVLGLLPMYLPK